ncbi:glycosyltransferase family 2 protein [Planococcus sp. YIM B11945]|uniref:glycosyltransferase family 2 protein n=1 Tax=Planococcus sp. YIM B11945 TaxID=3435410 RepID=UPI003D7ED8C0
MTKSNAPEFNEENIRYNQHGYYVKNKESLNRKKTVTVVTPVYNASKFISKTIDSVISQSLHIENIEFILVDDHSTDSSREILWNYAEQHKDIVAVFLKDNTGSPAHPRNVGIDLASSDFICFLDADDWLDPEALEVLTSLLEETGDDYVVGKTLKATSTGYRIIGEHQSIVERRSVPPCSIPNIFHHMGSNAKMMKRQLLIDHNIRFPHMKYAEDKQFYMDVILHSNKASTTRKAVSYLNRLDENGESLTNQTDIFEKMDTNLKVIEHIKQQKLPVEQEKIVLNRLYEFDFITQLFDPAHFSQSTDKQAYYDKFQEALDTAKDLGYDISKNFFHPICKVIYRLFLQGKYASIEALVEWNKHEKSKHYVIKNNLPYMVVPFFQGEFKHIRVPMLALYKNEHLTGKRDSLEFQVFGDYTDEVNGLVFRNKTNLNEEYVFAFEVKGKGGDISYTASIPLKAFPASNFTKFIRYNTFRKLEFTNYQNVRFERNQYTATSYVSSTAKSASQFSSLK